MALKATHKETTFGVGDSVKVTQRIKEGDKIRSQTFGGMVIGIKGRGVNKSFTVRRIGVGQIGIERIYPLISPTIENLEVVRSGTKGVRRAKLYYIREKSKREVEAIYSRAARKDIAKKAKAKKKKVPAKAKRTAKKKTTKTGSRNKRSSKKSS